jgi:hypothetical protein
VTLAGVAANGTSFFDTDVTYAKRLRATVSGAGVTVTSVSVPDPSHVTLTLAVSADAAAGARGVTVVNPDGQSTFSPDAITLGAALDAVELRRLGSGKFELRLTGAGFASSATVLVDGIAFATPPRSTSPTEIVQRGKLANGKTLNRAIRRGQTVTISVQTGGGVLTLSYTRP